MSELLPRPDPSRPVRWRRRPGRPRPSPRPGEQAADRSDGGQTLPLVAALVALAAAAVLALGPVGRAVTTRTAASTAADAAALAGAVDGEPGARRLAEANGGELARFDDLGDTVVVEIELGGVVARASARATSGGSAGGAGLPAGGGGRAGLAPAMLAALARADALLGRPVPVVSGLRTRAQQQALWDHRSTNPFPVARPGASDHERGLAIDVPRPFVDDLRPVAAASGLCQPLPATDPVHFVVCGA